MPILGHRIFTPKHDAAAQAAILCHHALIMPSLTPKAEAAFLKHLASVDASKGPVTKEIIKDTAAQQDKINKTRKSLMLFTSVTITSEPQKAYVDKQASKKGGPSTSASSTSTSNVSRPLSPQSPITL
ncbi:hypothetical protein LENED_005528 [Lentinula edodes]|uniref:Uncharacterized protein n=1 Tax=Lentinula edodes TaxID=5353 RepID=A0A1Q3E984_LENED|nr:hypothetical protein LENED_005528 [Lentinula edodes]